MSSSRGEPAAPDSDAASRRGVPVVGRLDDAESALTTMLREAEDEDDLRLAQIARLELMRSKLSAARTRSAAFDSRRDGRALDAFREPPDEGALRSPTTCRRTCTSERRRCTRWSRPRDGPSPTPTGQHDYEAMAARILVAWAVAGGPTPVPEAIRACEQLVEVADREAPGGPLFARDPARDARQDRRCSGSSRPCAGVGTGTDAWAVSDDDSCARPRESGTVRRRRRCRGRRLEDALSLPELGASAHHLKPPRASRSLSCSVTRHGRRRSRR